MEESMNFKMNITPLRSYIFWLIFSTTVLSASGFNYSHNFSEHPVFSAKFAAYLSSRANTDSQLRIVERILDLTIDTDQAKEVISRVPFLTVSDRLHLFKLLDERQAESRKIEMDHPKDGRSGFISLGEEDERRKILKKFLLTKVKTEEDYSLLMESFQNYPKVLDLFMAIRTLNFLSETDIALCKKIAHGQIEAYFSQSVSISEYAEQAEISSVENLGFTEDLPKSAGTFGRYRYHYRAADTFKNQEFYAEAAVEAGNDSLREEDEAQLEYLRLEWKGSKSELIAGDNFLELSTAALDREIRGLTWTRKIDTNFPSNFSAFVGTVPHEFQDLDKGYEEWLRTYGLMWSKNWGDNSDIGIYFIDAMERGDLGSGKSQIFGIRHRAQLSRQLDFSIDFSSSYGSYNTAVDAPQRSSAGELELNYNQDEISGAVSLKRSLPDYVSLLGYGIAGTTELDSSLQVRERWGSWSLFGHYLENQADNEVISLETIRPGLNLNIINFLGLNGLNADYGYDESREESSDRTVLFESNNHWLQLSRNFKRLRFDASLNYREYFDINVSKFANKESQVRLATHGHFFLRGRAISPLVELSAHRQELISGRVDERTQGSFQLTSQILQKGQFHTRYSTWKNESDRQYQDQSGQSLELSLDYPFERDWKRSLKLDYAWEELNLNSSLSHGAVKELKLSYNKRF